MCNLKRVRLQSRDDDDIDILGYPGVKMISDIIMVYLETENDHDYIIRKVFMNIDV